MVHCTYLGVSGYIFCLNIFFCLYITSSVDPDAMSAWRCISSGSSLLSKILAYGFPEYKGLNNRHKGGVFYRYC